MDKVGAVILNYNSVSDTKKCIDFLNKQNYKNLDIIVVDNHSSLPDEEKNVKNICEENKAIFITNKENLGYAAGNNMGLRQAVKNGAKWCMIINPDVELRDENYITHMLEKMEEYDKTVVAASSVVMPDGELQNPQKESTFFYDFLWPLQYIKKKEEKSNWNVEKQETKYCDKISGCCLFVKSDFLEKINYLDENTFLYCEEAILCRQAVMHGKKVLYVHDCVANHEHIKTQKSSPKGRMKIFLKSRRYFIRNYSGYGFVKRNLAVFSNKIEELIWSIKR